MELPGLGVKSRKYCKHLWRILWLLDFVSSTHCNLGHLLESRRLKWLSTTVPARVTFYKDDKVLYQKLWSTVWHLNINIFNKHKYTALWMMMSSNINFHCVPYTHTHTHTHTQWMTDCRSDDHSNDPLEVPFVSGTNGCDSPFYVPTQLLFHDSIPEYPAYLVSSRSIYKSSQSLPAVKFVYFNHLYSQGVWPSCISLWEVPAVKSFPGRTSLFALVFSLCVSTLVATWTYGHIWGTQSLPTVLWKRWTHE